MTKSYQVKPETNIDPPLRISRHELNVSEFVKRHVGDLSENFVQYSLHDVERFYDMEFDCMTYSGLPQGNTINGVDIALAADKIIFALFNMMSVLEPDTDIAKDLYKVSGPFKDVAHGGSVWATLEKFAGSVRDLWEWGDIYDVKLN